LSFHPGKQATIHIDSERIGVLGEVHPERLSTLDIKERVFFAQLDLHDLLVRKGSDRQMKPLPLYPSSDRDWTITVKYEVFIDQIFDALSKVRSKLLKGVSLIDLYESEKLGKDRKNVTLRFIYRSEKGTIEQPQVEKEHARIVSELSGNIKDFCFI